MHDRREFLTRALGGSSLLAVGSVVPEFLMNAAAAADKAEKHKDTVLVVIELTGGNDGLNTVAPYADDLYHKARPTLAMGKKQVLKLDDYCGLHPRMAQMKQLYDRKMLAVVQGIGYPNPDRSHFESMDIWQLADPKRSQSSGWLARTIPSMSIKDAGVPGMFIGNDRLPVALQGADGGVISLADRASFKLQLSGNEKSRKRLIEELNSETETSPVTADLAAFVRRRQLQTYSSLQKIEEALREAGTGQPNQPQPDFRRGNRRPDENDDLASLNGRLGLIARMIKKGLGTRIYYVQHAGFDTHSGQEDMHASLLGDLSDAVGNFFSTFGTDEAGDRVVLMTYSEFGRRVKENGSRGTDHGSGSCLFVAGNKVAGGLVGKHPSLSDLTDGDLRYHTDFRRVYATLLDEWLGVESRTVLDEKFDKLPLIDRAKKADHGTVPAPVKGAAPVQPPSAEPAPPAPVKDEGNGI
jgi:uncharacterized protein (DUF1501 family)